MTARAAAKKPRTAPALKIRTGAGIDLEQLKEFAGLYATVDDAAALLGVDAAALSALLDDSETPQARIWRQGRAEARLNLRRAQFAQIEKNATLAIYLGKEILGQDGNGPAGPVTFVVDTGIRRDDPEAH